MSERPRPELGRRTRQRGRPLLAAGLLAAALGLAGAAIGGPRGCRPTALLAAASGAAAPPATGTAEGSQEAVAAPAVPKTEQCQAVQAELLGIAEKRIVRWERAAAEGRTILGYGGHSSRLLNRTLASFDTQVRQRLGSEEAECVQERQALQDDLQRQLHSIFLTQRSTLEQALYQRLKKDLLARMRRKKRELTVKEKLRMLHSAMKEYDSQVRELLPFFVADPERDRAERRLSELQWGIIDSAEGKEMQQRWKMDRLRRMSTQHQSKGPSVSLSPGLRLMFRPGGFGNMQIFSRRQVGPPHNPGEVSIGVLNDGNVVDIYNKKPSPPMIKLQPTIGVDISMG